MEEKIDFDQYLKIYNNPSSANTKSSHYCVLGGLLQFISKAESVILFPEIENVNEVMQDEYNIKLDEYALDEIIELNDIITIREHKKDYESCLNKII